MVSGFCPSLPTLGAFAGSGCKKLLARIARKCCCHRLSGDSSRGSRGSRGSREGRQAHSSPSNCTEGPRSRPCGRAGTCITEERDKARRRQGDDEGMMRLLQYSHRRSMPKPLHCDLRDPNADRALTMNRLIDCRLWPATFLLGKAARDEGVPGRGVQSRSAAFAIKVQNDRVIALSDCDGLLRSARLYGASEVKVARASSRVISDTHAGSYRPCNRHGDHPTV